MKAHGEGGHVVNTSSMAGMIPVPAFAGIYATSKFAVRGMADALRLALGPYRIGVSVLCPGVTRTRAMTAGDLYRQSHFGKSGAGERRDPILHGMDPDELGRRVAEAIERNQPYIFPDGGFREMLAAFPTEYEIDPERRTGEERRARAMAAARRATESNRINGTDHNLRREQDVEAALQKFAGHRFAAIATSLAALATAMTALPALAQEPEGADAESPDRASRDIIVTGTRVVRSGFSAPTPLTVINSELFETRAATNVGQVLTELPSFRATTSPTVRTVRPRRFPGHRDHKP
jgi:hypothetical protein